MLYFFGCHATFCRFGASFVHNRYLNTFMRHKLTYQTKKKFLLTNLLTLSLFLAVGLSSCENDDFLSRKLNYGTVVLSTTADEVPGSSKIFILRDDGTRLDIQHSDVNPKLLSQGLRLIAEYSILDDITPLERSAMPIYAIRLHSAYQVLCKEPVLKSDAPEPSELGRDPLTISRAWVSVVGDFAYMNIDFHYPRYSPQIIHYINLWINNDDTDSNTWACELRHDAKGNLYAEGDPMYKPFFNGFGRVSFKIRDYIDYGDEAFSISFNDGYSQEPKTITVKVNERNTPIIERFAENFENAYN